MQGAQETLDKKRSNAVDAASLRATLFRSANIPARYGYAGSGSSSAWRKRRASREWAAELEVSERVIIFAWR